MAGLGVRRAGLAGGDGLTKFLFEDDGGAGAWGWIFCTEEEVKDIAAVVAGVCTEVVLIALVNEDEDPVICVEIKTLVKK